MKNSKIILLLIIFTVTLSIQAQEQLLQGKILNKNDVEGIHILNTTSRYNSVTAENGNFSIRVKVNDTLVFSSVSFMPEKMAISQTIYEKGVVMVTLTEMVNELAEVNILPNLSGNITTDLQKIKTEKPIDFEEAGLPGFKGKPQEKIVPLAVAVIPIQLQLEPLYKHISGYYKQLKIRRKWDAENITVAKIFDFYNPEFLLKSYEIPIDRQFDFLLFCIETTTLQSEFKNENYVAVLSIFEDKGREYVSRLQLEKE